MFIFIFSEPHLPLGKIKTFAVHVLFFVFLMELLLSI